VRRLERTRVAKLLKAYLDGDIRLSEWELGFLESIEGYDDDRELTNKQEPIFARIWEKYGGEI